MFHKPKHILIILASESATEWENAYSKKTVTYLKSGHYFWSSKEGVTHQLPIKILRKVLSVADIKCYWTTPTLNIEDYPVSSTWLGHMGWNPEYWANGSIKVSKVASKAHVSLLHLAAQKQGRRGSEGITELFAGLPTAQWRENFMSPHVYSSIRNKV